MKVIKYTNYKKTINNILLHSNIVVFKADPIEFIDTIKLKHYLGELLFKYMLNYDICNIIADFLIKNTSPILISILIQLKLFKYPIFLSYVFSKDFNVYNFFNFLSDNIRINIIIFKPQDYQWNYKQNIFYIDIFNNNSTIYKNTFLLFSDIIGIGYHYNYYKHIKWVFLRDDPIINTHDNLNEQNYMVDIDYIEPDVNLTYYEVEWFDNDEDEYISFDNFLDIFINLDYYDNIYLLNNMIKNRVLLLIYLCIDLDRIIILIYNNTYYFIGKRDHDYDGSLQTYELLKDGGIKQIKKNFHKIKSMYSKGYLRELCLKYN